MNKKLIEKIMIAIIVLILFILYWNVKDAEFWFGY